MQFVILKNVIFNLPFSKCKLDNEIFLYKWSSKLYQQLYSFCTDKYSVPEEYTAHTMAKNNPFDEEKKIYCITNIQNIFLVCQVILHYVLCWYLKILLFFYNICYWGFQHALPKFVLPSPFYIYLNNGTNNLEGRKISKGTNKNLKLCGKPGSLQFHIPLKTALIFQSSLIGRCCMWTSKCSSSKVSAKCHGLLARNRKYA